MGRRLATPPDMIRTKLCALREFPFCATDSPPQENAPLLSTVTAFPNENTGSPPASKENAQVPPSQMKHLTGIG
ncbi:uncharacterized protein N7477_001555 [Penicillium maclennaniae]|uniref:uncharacterized protein n=1 Tax=Penicillium maclennaniae TaxID=1343394 RepID=UPI002541A2C6|nr:uncharacterized protein N7477_001555 [Penicillium maclennaniae]KAJ5681615.1 hypothetical protein N7477_001555 [Penicillium maclennaniae]